MTSFSCICYYSDSLLIYYCSDFSELLLDYFDSSSIAGGAGLASSDFLAGACAGAGAKNINFKRASISSCFVLSIFSSYYSSFSLSSSEDEPNEPQDESLSLLLDFFDSLNLGIFV